MARSCTVCVHSARGAIDAALVAGTPALRTLAAQYAVSAMALHRHSQEHLPEGLTKAQEAAEVADADTLLARLQGLLSSADEQYGVARGLVARAVKAEDLRSATGALVAGNGALREARSILALLLEVQGRLSRTPTINIVVTETPEWQVVMETLAAFPAARLAVAARLAESEAA